MVSGVKSARSKYITTVLSSLILIADLLFLYFLKYHNQGLPLKDFSFFFIGNLLNSIFLFILLLGLLFYTIRKKIRYSKPMIFWFTAAITFTLLFAAFSAKVKLPLPNVYFLDHPLHLIFVGALFTFYQFLEFVFIVILWSDVLGGRELVVLRSVVNSVVLCVLLLITAFIYINLKKPEIKKIKSDGRSLNVAVVLGAAVWSHNSPSPSLAARVDKAVSLYESGIVNRILLTGSNAPGERSESEVAVEYVKLSDVNPADVWLEKNTVSTTEQIQFIREHILTKKNIGRIIIVSDGYHLTRVREICRFYGVKASVAASNLRLSFDHNLYYKMKESIALLVFWFFAL